MHERPESERGMLKPVILVGGVVGVLLTGIARYGPAPEAQPRGSGRADERPLTVEEYTPRSTLVVDETMVPRARFPVVDVHSHHRRLSAAQWAGVVEEMDALNLQVLVNLSGGFGDGLASQIATVRESPSPDRMVFFANLDFSRGVYPGFGEAAARQLEADVAAGAGRPEILQELRDQRA